VQRAHLSLEAAQPDFIIESVVDLPPVIEHIESLMRRGISPRSWSAAAAQEVEQDRGGIRRHLA
jgi:hypothetical protein